MLHFSKESSHNAEHFLLFPVAATYGIHEIIRAPGAPQMPDTSWVRTCRKAGSAARAAPSDGPAATPRCSGTRILLHAGKYRRNQLISGASVRIPEGTVHKDLYVLFFFKEKKTEVLPQPDVLWGGRSLRSPSTLTCPIIKVTVWLV